MGRNGRGTDPIASYTSRHARQGLIPDKPIVAATFGQGRGATPRVGPDEAGGPAGRDAWPGSGEGREHGLPRIRMPIGLRPFDEAPCRDCIFAEARRGVAVRLPPGAVAALSGDLTDDGTGSGNLKLAEKARRTLPTRGSRDPNRGQNGPKAPKLVGSDKRQLSIPIALKKQAHTME